MDAQMQGTIKMNGTKLRSNLGEEERTSLKKILNMACLSSVTV
jgi:hypothetical protein